MQRLCLLMLQRDVPHVCTAGGLILPDLIAVRVSPSPASISGSSVTVVLRSVFPRATRFELAPGENRTMMVRAAAHGRLAECGRRRGASGRVRLGGWVRLRGGFGALDTPDAHGWVEWATMGAWCGGHPAAPATSGCGLPAVMAVREMWCSETRALAEMGILEKRRSICG